MMTRLIKEKAAFHKLKKEWQGLLSDCDSKNIFMTWEWLYTWWRTYGQKNSKQKLSMIEMRDRDGRLVGIGPLKQRVSALCNSLELIGDGGDVTPEYLDLIIRRGYEKRVRKTVAELLNEVEGVDVINFKPLQGEKIHDWNDIQWPYKIIRKSSICPVVDLPTNWKEFLKTKSKNFSKKSQEYYRNCRRDLNLRFIRTDSQNELDGRMKDLEHLHHLRWMGKSASFLTDGYRQFQRYTARQFFDRDWLRLFFLLDGEKPIAALYCFAYNGVYYYYQSGRDPAYAKYRLGFVLMNLCIQEAINEGARVFDMLTGQESYKYRWANRDNFCYHFLAFKNKRAYVKHHLHSLFHKLFLWRNHRICRYL